MDKRVLRERMRRKQQQLRRRRMMKRVTCVIAAVLLLIFVVRGVILPIANRIGGGSNKEAETVNVQANASGASSDNSTGDDTASADTADSSESSSDNSSTDATVMPVKGTAAGDRLSVMTPGWHEGSNGKWYQNPDGTYYINGFAEIDGTTYSFDENGYMQTGWVEKGVKDYYFNEDGSYDPSKKRPMIALTFDDGPGEYTETLLDTVEKYNIHVTFFMLGQNVEGRESTVQRMLKLGCEIGNHTWDHPSQTLPNMDLDSVLQRIHQLEEQLEDIEARGISAGQGTYGAAGSMAAFGTCGLPGQPSAGSDPAGSLQQSPSGDSGQTSAGISMGSAAETISLPKAQLEDLNLIRNEWAKIVRSIGGGARSYLRDTVVEPGGEGCLTIVFLDPMSYDMGKRPTVIGELERKVEAAYGKSIYFKTRLAGRGERLDTIYVTKEDLEEKIHMDITYED